MVQLKSMILKRFSLLFIFIFMCFVLSGCSISDDLNPALNKEDVVKTDPLMVVYDFDDAKYNPFGDLNGPSIDSVYNPPTSIDNDTSEESSVSRNGYLLVEPSKFETFGKETVTSSEYTKYLNEKIINPINELLNELPEEDKSKIYFRVMHSGYDLDEDGNAIPSSSFNYSRYSMVSRVSGYSITRYAIDWLSNLDFNTNVLQYSKASLLNRIDNFTSSMTIPEGYFDWGSVDNLQLKTYTSFPKDILNIMCSDCNDFINIGSYIAAINNSNSVNVIPNLCYTYYNGVNSRQYITLNEVNSYREDLYDGSVSKNTLDKIFINFNQCSKRKFDTIDKIYSDNDSYLYAFTNGYNRTLVFIGVNPDAGLKNVLGNEIYNKVINLINCTKSAVDISGITASGFDLKETRISADAKGVC